MMRVSRAGWRRDLRSFSTTPDDAGFALIVARGGELDDAGLAELIETDGRARLAAGLEVRLQRYLEAIPGLAGRLEPLDAAIDVTLRSMAGSGTIESGAVDRLIAEHPSLERAIRDCAALNNAVCSTTGLRSALAGRKARRLPSDFGPRMDSGLPRYELREVLGAGGYGEVYLAYDRQLSEPDRPATVAVKILNARHSGPWSRQRFVDEATKVRRINHPNVVRVLDRGVAEGGELFIVYEHVEGGDLGRWFASRGGPLAPREAASLLAKIARGVHAAHSAGVIHCDLKPGNILRTADGEPKVADFGIAARLGGAEDPDGEQAPRPLGNLAFIAPEQFRMEDEAQNVSADVYALGGILFYLMTGRLPSGNSPEEIRKRHQSPTHAPPAADPRAAGAPADRDLCAIVRRALAPAASDRYTSASALADDLNAWLRGEPIAWTRPGTARIAMLWVRRKPWQAVASAVALCAVVALAGTMHWYSGLVRERTHEAEIAAAIARERDRQVAQAKSTIAEAYRALKNGYLAGEGEPAAKAVGLLDWIADRTVLGEGGPSGAPDRDRIALAAKRIEHAIAAGRGSHLQTLLARTALAASLLEASEFNQAETLLEELRPEWAELLQPGDAWFTELDALAACAAAGRIAAAAAAGGSAAVAADELLRVRSALVDAHSRLTDVEPRSPVAALVARAQRQLSSLAAASADGDGSPSGGQPPR